MQKDAASVQRATVRPRDLYGASGRTHQQYEAALLASSVRSYVQICADIVAKSAAAQPLRLYRRGAGPEQVSRSVFKAKAGHLAGTKAISYADDADEMHEVREHSMLDALRGGNDVETGGELDYFRFLSLMVTGNAMAHVDVESSQIFMLRPQWTRMVLGQDGTVKGWMYGAQQGQEAPLPTTEVIHWRYAPSMTDPYYGVGPLHACLQDHTIHGLYRQAEESRARRGGRPDVFIELPEGTTPDQAEEHARRFEDEYGHPDQAGGTYASTGKIITANQNNREMEYTQGLDNLRQTILAAIGVPEPMITMNDANLASSLTGNLQFMRQTILPLINRDADKLTETLIPMWDLTPGEYWFAYDNPVPEDEEAKVLRVQGLHSSGIITVNEARAQIGLDPIEGGDELATQQPEPSPFPFTLSQTVEAPAPAPVKAKAYPEPCGCGKCDTLPVKSRADRVKAAKATYELIEAKDDANDDRAEPLDRELRRHRNALERVLAQFYAQDLVSRLRIGDVITLEGAESALYEAVRPIIGEAFEASARDSAAEIGSSFDVVPERAIEALDRSTLQFAQSVTQTETDRIQRHLSSGLEQGQSIDEIRDAIVNDPQTGLRGDRGRAQAERIARTELAEATTQGKISGWESAGVTEMEWLLSPNPCPQCAGFAKQFEGRQKIGQPFLSVGETYTDADGKTQEITFRDINGPPLHPGCRCAVVAVID